jgi:hypothetical protein
MSSVEDARFAPSVVVQALDMIQSAVGHTPRSSRYCSGAPQLINKEVAKSSLKAHPRRCFFLHRWAASCTGATGANPNYSLCCIRQTSKLMSCVNACSLNLALGGTLTAEI